jgi:NADH-quinone oxidoreductase subunit H
MIGIIDSSSDHYLSRHLVAIPLFLLFTLLFITLLIASGRAPFDMPEAESELITGCFTDLGGISFSLCFLVDYLEILA